MKVLVTGGAGYIGTELTRLLAKNEAVDEVIIYDNLSRENHNSFLGHRYSSKGKVRFVEGELLDSRKLKRALDGVDVVYHLAAKVTTPFANTDPHFLEQVNHWGTAELAYALEESQVQRLIYTSSMSVYGSGKQEVTEESEVNPRTFYGISKMRGEEHVRTLGRKMNTLVLRCANVYGYSKSMRFDAVINRFMFDANFNGRITIHGNGKQHRPFIRVDLLAQVLHDALGTEVPSGTYNVVDRNLSVLDLVDVLKELYEELEYIFINQHLKLREIRVSSESKLKQYIPFRNDIDLLEELRIFRDKFAY